MVAVELSAGSSFQHAQISPPAPPGKRQKGAYPSNGIPENRLKAPSQLYKGLRVRVFKGDGAGKGGAGKGGAGKGTSGGKGRGGWVEARVNITAGSRNKYIGGEVTKINYLKVTLLQTDNPLVHHRIFEPSPHPLCTDPTLTLTPQRKQAASEVLHDLHVSIWLSDHYELTLGKEGAGGRSTYPTL